MLRIVGTPVALGLVLAGLYAYVSSQTLDRIEQQSLNAEYILSRTLKHVELTAIVAALVLLIAVPLGILLTRPGARRLNAPVLAVANIGQAVPSIGLLVLFAVAAVALSVDVIAVIAFVLYGILPVLRNTIVGLQQVDSAVIEAARGMGMSRGAVLRMIELPLAVPVILAGIRTALVITTGTVALATFVGAGGLGDVISRGIASNKTVVLVTGSVLVAVLALFIDWLAGLAEDYLRPRGL
ncbi:ABC transporter permease [Pseudonocardia nigra]|uniref:ABC transporter permease n=1 Tax=Pseudonocardia nigra TaxID=1921578 RepID=UPI0027E33D97|nr:ABC transporter permease [Pseudonocardia nigra]